MLHLLPAYLQSSKVEPGDESASCLRSSSLSRVTWRSWYKIVSSFSLICLVSITGGGDDALPVVPDEGRNTWQWANASKEQYNFTKEVNTNVKKSCLSVCRILSKNEVIHISSHQWVERRITPVRSHASRRALCCEFRVCMGRFLAYSGTHKQLKRQGKLAVTIAKMSETDILTEVKLFEIKNKPHTLKKTPKPVKLTHINLFQR